MSESGGRRIKRSISIDMTSVRFLDDEALERLAEIGVGGKERRQLGAGVVG